MAAMTARLRQNPAVQERAVQDLRRERSKRRQEFDDVHAVQRRQGEVATGDSYGVAAAEDGEEVATARGGERVSIAYGGDGVIGADAS
jgi:hypothetical protein